MMIPRDNLADRDLQTPSVKEMAKEVLRDLSQHFNLDTQAWNYELLHKLAMIPATKFARLMHYVDDKVRSHPVWEVARDILPRFTVDWRVTGGMDLPREGPLLVVANHPGAADSIAALAALERHDVHVLANERPTLTAMPNASNHIFYLDAKSPARFDVMRGLIDILKRGETVFMFPRGNLEPDPARYPGALESLKDWSQSVGVFLSQVPETMLQVILTQNVITRQAWNNPLAALAKTEKVRHQIAMILQMLSQEVFGIWKEPIEIVLPKPLAARELASNLDPRAINAEIKRFIAGEMQKTFEIL